MSTVTVREEDTLFGQMLLPEAGRCSYIGWLGKRVAYFTPPSHPPTSVDVPASNTHRDTFSGKELRHRTSPHRDQPYSLKAERVPCTVAGCTSTFSRTFASKRQVESVHDSGGLKLCPDGCGRKITSTSLEVHKRRFDTLESCVDCGCDLAGTSAKRHRL